MFAGFICCEVLLLLNFKNEKISIFLLALCILPLIMVPYILDKIKVFNMNEKLIFIYYLFLLLALILGSIFGFYRRIWWFDLFTHFTSGFLTILVAYFLLKKNNLISKKYKWFNFLFILIFSISIAGIWEFFEFTIDQFGLNVQHSLETGVNDTMEDMLVATLAGFISSFYYLNYMNKRSS